MANQLAWGFIGLQHLFDQRLTTVSPAVIDDAITQSLAEWNRQISELTDVLVQRTTASQERFRLPGAGTLQPLDEHGVPYPVRVGAFADIGFPIQGGGTAWGTNRVSRAMMTVGEANELQVMVQTQDADWMRRHILAALLDNTAWTFGDPDVGDYSVFPLANGDTQQYLLGSNLLATDQHYTAQAAGIADGTNPYPGIEALLAHHPGNDGPFVSYIADSLRATTEALATFVPVSDPDIILGSASDRLAGVPAQLRAFGDEVIGKVGGMWIVTYNALPAGYIISLALGAAAPALAMREYPEGSLQGLFREEFRPDSGREQVSFIRYAGFGVRNRTAGVATFIGNAAYQIPPAFATPLAA